MNYYKRGILGLLIIFWVTQLISAKTIIGTVLDEDSNPVVGCYISAVELPDSTFLSVTQSNYEGIFSLEYSDKYNNIAIIADKPGWKNIVVNESDSPLRIILKRDDYTLKELEVSAKKPLLSYKKGKIIYDPTLIIPNVSTGAEILQQVPFVMASSENVSIMGHGDAMVYINGKRPNISQSAVWQYLKNLNPKYVKSVQLVTDKGSGFSSQNNKPIVNIVIDDETIGFNGTFSAKCIFDNNAFSPSAELYTNYTTEKFTINIQPYFLSDFDNIEKTNKYKLKQIEINESTKVKHNYYSGGVELNTSYQVNTNNELGAYASLTSFKKNNTSITNGVKIQDYNVIESIEDKIASTNKDVKHPIIDAGIYYYFLKRQHKLDFIIDARFNKSNDFTNYNLQEILFDENGRSENEATNTSLKYQYTTSKGIKINTGIEYLQTYSRRLVSPTIPIQETFGYGNYINMLIKENTGSVFADYSMPLGSLFFFNAGVRSEYYNRNASFDNVDYKYNKLFIYPNISVSFNYPKYNQNLILKYNITSSPAYYSQLNPAKKWITSTSYKIGNPYLPNGYTHLIEANYYLLDKFLVQAYYSRTENVVQTISRNINEYVVYEDVIGKHSNYFGLCLAFSKQYGKYISLRLENSIHKYNGELFYGSKFLKYSNIDWYFNGMIIANLSKKFGINMILSGWVSSPTVAPNASSDGWRYNLWFMIRKDFGKYGNVEFIARNLLYLKERKYFNSEDYSYTIQDNNNPMFLSLKYSIQFGKKKTRNINRIHNSSIESRYL